MNVLEEIPWLVTNKGRNTVREAFADSTISLSEEVPGFVYGAQFRFLLTILPLLRQVEKSENSFSQETIDAVFEKLRGASDLFSEDNPFLQISSQQVDGKQFGHPTDASKLFPHGLGVEDNANRFWSGTVSEKLSLPDAVLGLVVYYFYTTGTNTVLLKGSDLKLTNGSSALQYLDSVEIIPQGNSLVETLTMNTPKTFVEEGVLPHWADRQGSIVTDPNNPLWRFSWSANTVHCEWDDERNLTGITRGGVPKEWNKNIPLVEGEKWPKTFHGMRQETDPLFFYNFDAKTNSFKLKRFSLSTDPYFVVAQWNAENASVLLANKWTGCEVNAMGRLQNITFLEHVTEGASSSFSIRYSNVVRGFRDELFPTENEKTSMETISSRYKDVLTMRSKLLGFFTENGTCNYLKNRRKDVDKYFWDELHDFANIIVEAEDNDVIHDELMKRALRAFNKVSTPRDSIHIEKHLHATKLLSSTFWEKK